MTGLSPFLSDTRRRSVRQSSARNGRSENLPSSRKRTPVGRGGVGRPPRHRAAARPDLRSQEPARPPVEVNELCYRSQRIR